MQITRRHMLATGAGAATLAATPRAFAAWEPSLRYPDPAVQVLDPSFAGYRVAQATVEQLFTGGRFGEGPVWFGDARCVLWSDIPNNRIMRWDEASGLTTVFRQPSNYANGLARDRQGRLIACEPNMRRVTRTEYDGTITVLIDRFDGKPLNSPNDVIVKSDDTIWFSDPAAPGFDPRSRVEPPARHQCHRHVPRPAAQRWWPRLRRTVCFSPTSASCTSPTTGPTPEGHTRRSTWWTTPRARQWPRGRHLRPRRRRRRLPSRIDGNLWRGWGPL